MNADLCIGISSRNEVLEVAAVQTGRYVVTAQFPATSLGIGAIKVFLASFEGPVRLAVRGTAALNIALALGGTLPLCEVFIVSCTIADQPIALAQYAVRSI